mmetsp:Transcript_10607/g.35135  ORF Transcript_10607/g.35135 Transcript_10607/m.35135 type:complete len:202 (-) Transcript_10607:574-1179(-)
MPSHVPPASANSVTNDRSNSSSVYGEMGCMCSAPKAFCTRRSQSTVIFKQTFVTGVNRTQGRMPTSQATCHARTGELESRNSRSGNTRSRHKSDKIKAAAIKVTATYLDNRASRQESKPPKRSSASAIGSNTTQAFLHGPANILWTFPKLTPTLSNVDPVLFKVINNVHVTCCSKRITTSAGFALDMICASFFKPARLTRI